MAVAGEANVRNARTTFETLVDGALQQQREQGIWQAFARRYNGGDSIAYQINMPGATPNYEEWVGEKPFGGFRKLSKTIGFKKYHKSLDLPRESVVYDKTGTTAAAMREFVSNVAYVWDKLVFDSLKANPVGIDGVSLLNDTHPFGASGGTWDNKVTTALSFDAINTGRAFMRSLTDEFGEPLGIEPRVLLVHPDQERTALEIAQADARPVSVGTAGAINSGGIGATGLTNVYRGTIDVVVSARWTSGDWLLVDPRYSPIGLVVWRDPETVIADDMEGETRMKRDLFLYSVEADAAASGLQPYGVYGKIT